MVRSQSCQAALMPTSLAQSRPVVYPVWAFRDLHRGRSEMLVCGDETGLIIQSNIPKKFQTVWTAAWSNSLVCHFCQAGTL